MRVIRLPALVLSSAACMPLVLSACRQANEFQPPPPAKVTTAMPLLQTVVTYLEIPGRTQAIESVQVRARVEGFLQTIDFKEGYRVEKGDLLYTIEPELYAAAVKTAEARLANAVAVLSKAEFDLNRMRDLQSKDSASDVEIVEAETEFNKAQAEVASAEAGLESAKLNLDYTRVTAPIAGVVNRTEVNVGNLVGRGEQTVLTTIVPWHPMHVYATIGERDVLDWRRRTAGGEVRERVPVFLRLADGTDYPEEGEVDYVDNQVDVQTGTLRARAVVGNPQSLLVPGIFVRMRVPREPREAVLVPESALQRDLTGYYLFTVNAEREVSRADVVVGPIVGTYRTVESGVTAEDEVIIRGLQRVQPGLTVEAERVTLPPVEQRGMGSGSSDAGQGRSDSADPAGE